MSLMGEGSFPVGSGGVDPVRKREALQEFRAKAKGFAYAVVLGPPLPPDMLRERRENRVPILLVDEERVWRHGWFVRKEDADVYAEVEAEKRERANKQTEVVAEDAVGGDCVSVEQSEESAVRSEVVGVVENVASGNEGSMQDVRDVFGEIGANGDLVRDGAVDAVGDPRMVLDADAGLRGSGTGRALDEVLVVACKEASVGGEGIEEVDPGDAKLELVKNPLHFVMKDYVDEVTVDGYVECSSSSILPDPLGTRMQELMVMYEQVPGRRSATFLGDMHDLLRYGARCGRVMRKHDTDIITSEIWEEARALGDDSVMSASERLIRRTEQMYFSLLGKQDMSVSPEGVRHFGGSGSVVSVGTTSSLSRSSSSSSLGMTGLNITGRRRRSSVNEDGEFVCDECHAKFTAYHQYNRHMRKHVKPVVCDVEGCEERFVYARDMQRHKNSAHLGKPPIAVCSCGSTFRRTDYVHRHLKNGLDTCVVEATSTATEVERRAVERMRGGVAGVIHVCTCGAEFSRSDHFRAHEAKCTTVTFELQ